MELKKGEELEGENEKEKRRPKGVEKKRRTRLGIPKKGRERGVGWV